MNSNDPNNSKPSTSIENSSLLELIPGLTWEPVMTLSQYHEFREWWHDTVLPDLLALGRLIVRL